MRDPVAIVGSGLVGRAWAIAFARAGHPVRLHDPQTGAAQAALSVIEGLLADLADAGLLNEAPSAVLARLDEASDLSVALEGVVWVQESAPEDLALKQALWQRLDALAPDGAILASSSSALVPSRFTEQLPGRARCLVAHPLNPPYVIPAVELCPAPWTSPETMIAAGAMMRGIGQTVIAMRREIDGFVMNRLQAALVEEAVKLVAAGVCGPEEVDIALRDGLALRWSFAGPFETCDLNAPGGIRDYVARYGAGIFDRFVDTPLPRPDWRGPVLDEIEQARALRLLRNEIAPRQRWRDRRLMALLRHKRQDSEEIGD